MNGAVRSDSVVSRSIHRTTQGQDFNSRRDKKKQLINCVTGTKPSRYREIVVRLNLRVKLVAEVLQGKDRSYREGGASDKQHDLELRNERSGEEKGSIETKELIKIKQMTTGREGTENEEREGDKTCLSCQEEATRSNRDNMFA